MYGFKIPFRFLIAIGTGIVLSKFLDIVAHLILHEAGILPPLTAPNFSKHDQAILLFLHSIFAITSAFVTAVIAKEKARKATFILGTKEAIFWLIGMVLLWNHSPFWVNIAKAVLGPPLCWMGGKLYEARLQKKSL
jgi:hypothetical protein